MFKLVKYEFRKARAATLALLGIAAALEIYFLASLYLSDTQDGVAISGMLLFVCAYAAAIFVFVRGVTSYSGELKSKSSYLIFMTPNSSLKIMGSKYVYTFFNGVLFAALFGALFALDMALMLDVMGELSSFLQALQAALSLYGVYLGQFGASAVFMLAYLLLSVMSTFAAAYFAITVGHTLFRDKKWRWLPSLLLFFALTWAIAAICDQFPTPMEMGQVEAVFESGSAAVRVQTTAELLTSQVVPALLPTMGVCLASILLSLFGCAALLDRRVSL